MRLFGILLLVTTSAHADRAFDNITYPFSWIRFTHLNDSDVIDFLELESYEDSDNPRHHFILTTTDKLDDGELYTTKNGSLFEAEDSFGAIVVRFLPNTTTVEVLDFILDKVFGELRPRLKRVTTEFSWFPPFKIESVLDLLIAKGIKADDVSIHFVKEEKLLQFIKTTGAKNVSIMTTTSDAVLSDAFFQDSIVQNLQVFEAPNVTCLLTPESHRKMKARRLELTITPQFTFEVYQRAELDRMLQQFRNASLKFVYSTPANPYFISDAFSMTRHGADIRQFRIIAAISLQSGVRFTTKNGYEISIENERYSGDIRVKFLPNNSAQEALEFILGQVQIETQSRLFSLRIDEPWDFLVDFVTVRKIKADEITASFLGEKKLQELVKSAEPKKSEFIKKPPNATLSDVFFREPAVLRLEEFDGGGVVCQLTDETLLKMNASDLDLGAAPLISLAAVRRFLQPVIDGKMTGRSLNLEHLFDFDEKTLLEGLNATRVFGDTKAVWIGNGETHYEIHFTRHAIEESTFRAQSHVDNLTKILMSEQELNSTEAVGKHLRRLFKFARVDILYFNTAALPRNDEMRTSLTVHGTGRGQYSILIATVNSLGNESLSERFSTKEGSTIVVGHNGFNSIVNILPSTSFTEALEFVLEKVLGGSPGRFEKLTVEGVSNETNETVNLLIARGFKASNISTSLLEEKKLLQFIQSVEPKTVIITEAGYGTEVQSDTPRRLSEAFFRDSHVQNLENFEASDVACLMTDETFVKVKAFAKRPVAATTKVNSTTSSEGSSAVKNRCEHAQDE